MFALAGNPARYSVGPCQSRSIERNDTHFVALASAHHDAPAVLSELQISEHELAAFIQAQASLQEQLHNVAVAIALGLAQR